MNKLVFLLFTMLLSGQINSISAWSVLPKERDRIIGLNQNAHWKTFQVKLYQEDKLGPGNWYIDRKKEYYFYIVQLKKQKSDFEIDVRIIHKNYGEVVYENERYFCEVFCYVLLDQPEFYIDNESSAIKERAYKFYPVYTFNPNREILRLMKKLSD